MNSNAKLVKLTESDLRHIVKKTVHRLMTENMEMNELYNKLNEIMEIVGKDEFINMLCNCFDSNILSEFVDFAENELDGSNDDAQW